MSKAILLDKYKACLVLSVFGDMIGNKYTETITTIRNNIQYVSTDKVFSFISQGGLDKSDFNKYATSNVVPFQIATARALLATQSLDTYITTLIANYIAVTKTLDLRKFKATFDLLTDLEKSDSKIVKYGESTIIVYHHMLSIGLQFAGNSNLDNLIAYTIESTRVLRNTTTTILGSLTVSFFVSLGLTKTDVEKWPFLLLELIESGKIEKYLKKTTGLEEYEKDKDYFIDTWKSYLEEKFVDEKPIKEEHYKYPSARTSFYIKNIMKLPALEIEGRVKGEEGIDISLGVAAVVIAYDALLECMTDNGPSWEKLILYSSLQAGFGFIMGSIAGGWFGATYGFELNKSYIRDVKYKNDLEEIGQGLLEKRTKGRD